MPLWSAVHEALSGYTTESNNSSFNIADVAMVIPEVVFSNVTLKMLRANMLINTDKATLKDRKEALNSIGMNRTTDIFMLAMGYNAVLLKQPVSALVGSHFIGDDMGVSVDLVLHDRLERFARNGFNMEGTDVPTTLNQRKDTLFMGVAPRSGWLRVLGSPISFISLNDLAASADLFYEKRVFHGRTDTVRHEPCRLIGDFEGPVKLVAADPLLAGTKQVGRKQPFVQRNVGSFKQAPYSHRKRLAAVSALVKTWACRLALKLVSLVHAAAVRTDNTIRPANLFKVLAGGGFIVEVLRSKLAHYSSYSHFLNDSRILL